MSAPTHTSEPIVANMRVGDPIRELASGVDALYLSARTVLPGPFVAHLEDCREWAVEVKRRAPCQIGNAIFGISPYGWGKYRFCLDHQMARIGFSTSKYLPTVRIQPRAEYLHAIGPAAVLASLQETLGPQLGRLRFGVSRVDLFADWQGWSLSLDEADHFVCRADARRTYESGGILTGFEFGTRKTKTFSVRLYDKTAEIAAKGHEWWLEVWGERYEAGLTVHRLEFEIGRQGLTEFNLDTPDQVLAAAGDLWTYATGQWLTHRSPTEDQTRSRWPLSPQWQTVQRATLSHQPIGIERLRSSHRTTSIGRLLPGLTGYMASLGALIGTEGIEDTVGAVGHHLHNYEVISRTPFADRIERRRSEQEHR
jgi:hypothetical protein